MNEIPLFKIGKLYKISIESYQLSYDANGSPIPIRFNFIVPEHFDKEHYYINWKIKNIPTFFLDNGELLLCLNDNPKRIMFKNKHGSGHLGGNTIGFLYKNKVVIPWYNYVYEHDTKNILSKHIKLFDI